MLRDALGAFDVDPAVVEGRDRTYDLGLYDVKACGEVTTHPHLRVMSFRSEHYLKCMRAFARAQLPAGADSLTAANVPDAMLGLLFDGGKGHGAPCENDSPCIHVCTSVCVSIRLPLPICMLVCMCVRVCERVCECVCVVRTSICWCVCVAVWLYVWMAVRLYYASQYANMAHPGCQPAQEQER